MRKDFFGGLFFGGEFYESSINPIPYGGGSGGNRFYSAKYPDKSTFNIQEDDEDVLRLFMEMLPELIEKQWKH